LPQGAEFRGSFSGHERDRLFLNPNQAGAPFFDVAYLLGLDLDDDGRSVLPIDVDGDGDLDLAIASLQRLHLFENQTRPGSFARIVLRATMSESHAIGAVVSLTAGEQRWRGVVRATDGFQSQCSLELNVSLGQAQSIDELHVDWPSGERQSWRDLPVEKLLVLVEGRAAAGLGEVPRWPKNATGVPTSGNGMSLELKTASLSGGDRRTLGTIGKAAVVNFWAPSCKPCITELPTLAALSRKNEEVSFTGVCVDVDDPAGATRMVRALKLPYQQLLAEPELLESFFGPDGSIALPSTFVFDERGRLRRLFRRPVHEAELQSLLDSFEPEQGYASDWLRVAEMQMARKDYRSAMQSFRSALEGDDELAAAHNGVGRLWLMVGKSDQAEASFRRAVELDSEFASALYNLGALQLNSGRPAEAVASLEVAASIVTTHYDTQFSLAVALAQLKRFEAAHVVAKSAVQLRPQQARARVLWARILRDLGRVEEARRELAEAIRLDPDDQEARELLDGL
jgi:tetratricopeptide (TPR) repeat protein